MQVYISFRLDSSYSQGASCLVRALIEVSVYPTRLKDKNNGTSSPAL